MHPRFLNHHGPVSISLLTSIFTTSRPETKIPQEWRVVDIRPTPKGGKDLRKMESRRPISLTSTAGKTYVLLFTNHLRCFAESMHLLAEYQAGLRHCRSTEDQLLRLSQYINVGLLQSPIRRNVEARIDYYRAYDKVWRDTFLMKMSQKSNPSQMVQWIQARLSNRLSWQMELEAEM